MTIPYPAVNGSEGMYDEEPVHVDNGSGCTDLSPARRRQGGREDNRYYQKTCKKIIIINNNNNNNNKKFNKII